MKGQDVVLLLDLVVAPEDRAASYAALGARLHLSASQTHASTMGLIEARLILEDRTPRSPAVLEFLLHGVPYVFPAQVGKSALGIPTAWSAKPVSDQIASAEMVVWPYSKGSARGHSLEPIHRAVPLVAVEDARLYEMLALVDCVRIGRARERRIAEQELKARITDGISRG